MSRPQASEVMSLHDSLETFTDTVDARQESILVSALNMKTTKAKLQLTKELVHPHVDQERSEQPR